MKKIFTLLVAFLAIAGNAVWGQETITINEPKDLRDFAEKVNGNTNKDASWNVVLGANINLGGEEYPWTPIDNFKGTFDGKGYTISGVYIDNTNDDSNDFGFFASTSGTIQNLNIANSTIKVSVKDDSHVTNVGGIAGHVSTLGNISNCSFDGEINVSVTEVAITGLNVGGICGEYENETIESCYNLGNIDITVNKVLNGGLTDYGILGLYISGICNTTSYNFPSTNDIINSYNAGDITVSVNNFGNENDSNALIYALFINGINSRITENNVPSNITSCYNTGTINVSGETNKCLIGIGGINAKEIDNISYCYNIGKIESTVKIEEGMFSSVVVGNISGSAGETYNNNYYWVIRHFE